MSNGHVSSYKPPPKKRHVSSYIPNWGKKRAPIGHTTVLDPKVLPATNPELVKVGKNVPLASTIIPEVAGNGIYFAPSALMTINVWNSVSGQGVTFQCWYLDPSGDLKQVPSSGTSGVLADMDSLTHARAANTQTVTLPASGGTIVSFTARINQTGTATYRGQTLVKCEIDNTQNGGALNSTTEVIVYGYAFTRKDLNYPAVDSIENPTDGPGYLYSIITGTSSAGQTPSATLTVPTNARWRVPSLFNELQTDSTAGARTIALRIGTSSLAYRTPLYPAGAASNTYNIFGTVGYPSPVDSAYSAGFLDAHAFMPDTKLLAGQVFEWTSVGPGGAMDQWTGGLALIEEWLEPST